MSIPIAPQMDFSEIPVIDLSSLIDGADVSGVIAQLTDACERVGFFYIKNHGVNESTVSELGKQAKIFFDLPVAEKQKLLVDYQMRGYLPLNYRSYEGEERASTSCQEGFWIGHETIKTAARPLDGPNRWPRNLPGFQDAMERYLAEVEEVAAVLINGFARALGVAPLLLSGLFDKPTSRLKLNHYPPQDNPVDVHNIGVLPHTDSGAFTILWQDNHGGLEIENKKGDWVVAPPIESTFVVNLGNIMPVWSGGRFSSTRHRVINRGGKDRYSIPLFVNPNQHETIMLLGVDDTEFDEGFNYGEYQSAHWRRAFPVAHEFG